jgi:hypothetical protein
MRNRRRSDHRPRCGPRSHEQVLEGLMSERAPDSGAGLRTAALDGAFASDWAGHPHAVSRRARRSPWSPLPEERVDVALLPVVAQPAQTRSVLGRTRLVAFDTTVGTASTAGGTRVTADQAGVATGATAGIACGGAEGMVEAATRGRDSNSFTRVTTASGSNGFARTPSQPTSKARASSTGSKAPVSSTTGMCARRGVFRMCRATS